MGIDWGIAENNNNKKKKKKKKKKKTMDLYLALYLI